MTLRFVEAPSPNFNERLHPLDMLVLHYTGMADGPSALARMRDPAAAVSAHYMVEEDGRVFRLVPEDKRAWQAGRSWWQGDEDLNSRSIGIEIVNGGHAFGLPPFPDEQIEAVIGLCRQILARWPIPQSRIVAHSDIAPDRKEDPGERFPWRRLAQAGIGFWPQAVRPGAAVGTAANPRTLQMLLSEIGYHLLASSEFEDATRGVLRAFQRRWRPEHVSGEPDAETLALIEGVAALVRAERAAS